MMILICGRPGSGKTTYSNKFSNVYEVLHLDEIQSYEGVIEKLFNINEDVVIEGIYDMPFIREEVVKAYHGKDPKKCIWLDTSIKLREKRRNHKIDIDYPFMKPTYEEGWDDIVIIKDNKEEQC